MAMAGALGGENVAAPKKEKVIFLHYHLTDLYKLRKVKYTLDIGDLKNRHLQSAEYVYTFERRTKEELLPIF